MISETELKQVVYAFKCNKSTLQVKGKLNSITLGENRTWIHALAGRVEAPRVLLPCWLSRQQHALPQLHLSDKHPVCVCLSLSDWIVWFFHHKELISFPHFNILVILVFLLLIVLKSRVHEEEGVQALQ